MSDAVLLSAVDFLKLIEERQIARVDLAEVGRVGVLFVRDINAGEKEVVLPRPKGRVDIKTSKRKGSTLSLDWSQMPKDAVGKFLRLCLVTDKRGGGELETLFAPDEDGNRPASVTVAQEVLVPLYDKMVEATGKTGPQAATIVMGQLESLPNAVANLLIKHIRSLSGLDDDADAEDEADEEKKD